MQSNAKARKHFTSTAASSVRSARRLAERQWTRCAVRTQQPHVRPHIKQGTVLAISAGIDEQYWRVASSSISF